MLRLWRRVRQVLGFSIARSPADVLRILDEELAGTGSESEWDEFQCVAIADPRLDQIRRAIPLEGTHTHEGRSAVEGAIAEVTRLLPSPAA
jgi:hypothetical protein